MQQTSKKVYFTSVPFRCQPLDVGDSGVFFWLSYQKKSGYMVRISAPYGLVMQDRLALQQLYFLFLESRFETQIAPRLSNTPAHVGRPGSGWTILRLFLFHERSPGVNQVVSLLVR
jgi:hypothetical protein